MTGGRLPVDSGRRTEDGGQKTEDRRQKTEDGGRMAEDGGGGRSCLIAGHVQVSGGGGAEQDATPGGVRRMAYGVAAAPAITLGGTSGAACRGSGSFGVVSAVALRLPPEIA